MGVYRVLAVLGVLALMPVAAAAQTPTQPQTETEVTTETETTTAETETETTTTMQTVTTDIDEPVESHWIASGFVGSNFGQDADSSSMDFGGSVGYLWNGAFGAEFQANFSPDFELEPVRSALLLGDQPLISSYMLNAVGAIPIGGGGVQPYVSGGLGLLTLRSDVIISDGEQNDLQPDDSRVASNIGGGVMGFFNDQVGIRGDVRYFRGFEESGGGDLDPVEDPAEAIGNQVLSELAFWRADVGIALRW